MGSRLGLPRQGLGIPLSKVGFPIRKSADQSLFAAPHGLSQRTTSFIASQRQGIHQMPLSHLIALIINAHPARQRTRSSVLANGSIGRTLIRKTSLLRIVPTACGQAADIALRYVTPSPQRLSSPCDVVTLQCSELRAGRDITSRSTLGAILPLHDVRYHAPSGDLAASRGCERRSCGRAENPAWWSQTGSNRRPPACKAGALPTELWPLRGAVSRSQQSTTAID